MSNVIAIILDDVLNYFSESLHREGILYDSSIHSITDPLLSQCLYNIKTGLLTKQAKNAMGTGIPRAGAGAFLQALASRNWGIVLCTDRDLRFTYDITVHWLRENHLPFDFLVQTSSPMDFCHRMGIRYLISDRPRKVGGDVTLFYRSASSVCQGTAHGFVHFEEVQKCLLN